MKNMIGSNQFRTKKRHTLNGRIGSWVLLTIITLVASHHVAMAIPSGVSLVKNWAKQTFITTVGDPVKLISPMAEPEKVYASELNIRVSKPVSETVEPTRTGGTTPNQDWDDFVIAVHKVAPMYNFPENVVLAQGALESAHGNSHFAKTRNNFLGIGAFDSNPNDAYTFENPEQCVIEYMRTIKRNFPEAWAQRDNSEKLLSLIVSNSYGRKYATDPNYIAKVKSMKEWK